MRVLPIVFAVLGTLGLKAQEWTLLDPAYRYNYSFGGTDTITEQVFVAHIDTLGPDSFRYVLNTVGVPCDTCLASLGGPCDGCFVWVDRPQFLQRSVIVTPGRWLFQDPDTFSLRTDLPWGSAWAFDPDGSVIATSSLPAPLTVFGQPDSVSVISLSTGGTITISRSFGIIRMDLPSAPHLHEAIGVEGADVGIIKAAPLDYFDLWVGDEFQGYYSYWWTEDGSHWMQAENRRRYRITARTDLPDSVSYQYVYWTGPSSSSDWFPWLDPGVTCHLGFSNASVLRDHPLLLTCPNEVSTVPQRFSDSTDLLPAFDVHDGKIWLTGGCTIGTASQQPTCALEDPEMDQCTVPGLRSAASCLAFQLDYSPMVGQSLEQGYCFEASWEAWVQPIIYHGDTVGGLGFWWWNGPLSIGDRPGVPSFTLGPDPANDRIHVRSATVADADWHIRDSAGRILKTGRSTHEEQLEIDVSALPPGLYLFDLMTGMGLGAQRFIVAR